MPTVLLREFADHVSQNEHCSDCVHIASLLLEQLSDLKARLGKGEVSKDAYVIDALRIVTDDFGVVSRAITPEFITELYSSTGAFGADAASERVHAPSQWFSALSHTRKSRVDVRAACLSTSCAKATSAPQLICEFALWAPFPRRCLHSDGILSRGRHESQLAPAGFVLESDAQAGGEASRGLGPFGLVHSLLRVCVNGGVCAHSGWIARPENAWPWRLGVRPHFPRSRRGAASAARLRLFSAAGPISVSSNSCPRPGFSETSIIPNPLIIPPGLTTSFQTGKAPKGPFVCRPCQRARTAPGQRAGSAQRKGHRRDAREPREVRARPWRQSTRLARIGEIGARNARGWREERARSSDAREPREVAREPREVAREPREDATRTSARGWRGRARQARQSLTGRGPREATRETTARGL
jgi:hypothetical protein